ncbi:unnamed protein product [Leptidea sinapis]|uniref:Uncharacterized protein n=1 Tax=Leptidea sinapis TaxID=189913 RepID=A0A5E4QQ62_9NEOP|nr:unnamed protein product [Leptidea sinapis]
MLEWRSIINDYLLKVKLGCDYTPALFRKGKLRPFKLLEQSEEYQLACQNIITDDEELLNETFKILEKLICHIYGARDSWNVNEVRFNLFSNTYRSKKSDDNFEKKFRNCDPSSLPPPCKSELYQHLLRVRYVTKFWRNAHLKHPTYLSPQASSWTINDDNNLLQDDDNPKDVMTMKMTAVMKIMIMIMIIKMPPFFATLPLGRLHAANSLYASATPGQVNEQIKTSLTSYKRGDTLVTIKVVTIWITYYHCYRNNTSSIGSFSSDPEQSRRIYLRTRELI